MKCIVFGFVMVFCSISNVQVRAGKCGCKTLTPCYANMISLLQEPNEARCIEDASIGTSTLTIFLRALKEFCSEFVKVEVVSATFDKRNLYEVVIQNVRKETEPESKKEVPVIIIDAGQEGGSEAVRLALFTIEQLIACQENKAMIQKVKWVFMPSANPDGLEFSRYTSNTQWRKNLRYDSDKVSFGVDISRNFDEQWAACPAVKSGFAENYPGSMPASEAETIFVKKVIEKHRNHATIYLTIKRDGHYIGYPFAGSDKNATNLEQLVEIAADVASKVNIRSGGVTIFKNDSIYNLEGKKRCGHSVDWAYSIGIKWAFEMRVYLESNNDITSMFQSLPKGYENTLRNGYYSGIRVLYCVLTDRKKYGKFYESKKY